MFSNIDPEIAQRVKSLKLELTDRPQPELLIPIPNPHIGGDDKINITSPEFTSLCPLAPSQPDYANIEIIYTPQDYIIELKSYKFYLVSFRNVCIFHEAVVGKICDDLVACIAPKDMQVTGDFKVRGGIRTIVQAKFNVGVLATELPY